MMIDFEDVFLGQLVRNSRHVEADRFVVKRIDRDIEEVYLVPLSGDWEGQWVSGHGLYTI